jgi:hypothetical protein
MGLRVNIQKALIELFKAGVFPSVTYDSTGVPSTGNNLTPTVICNETSAQITAKAGAEGIGYSFSGWSFEVICEFLEEVDYSDFVLTSLKDLNFNSSGSLVTATAGNNVIVKHPPRQGAHGGSVLTFTFNIKTRR